MDINGSVEFGAPAKRAVGAIQKREHLARLLPSESVLQERDDHGFDFTVQKSLGPLSIRLAGVITATPDPTGDSVVLRASGNHFLSGSADLNLLMLFVGTADRCTIAYSGTLEATGLAGKALDLGATKVQSRVQQAFEEFGARMERSWMTQKSA